ncbi:nucleotidyl transferase AbiEii/AbiGii toxin family protein [Flavobacteriaceae bacterium XHP0103]|uniref:nucleotidyl transferase AbiEii/AbiGii toxin family protein n=1 Tax=Marixanthotalea marina TaxID=2844359 RepID=UPI002989A9BC|nr:nucleotidyl transferase AbiEii/AbiGii toxin family protein [Marixanthotalea marina]MBU3820994.1 nucleotidyl transferase AbiEii/AbiGii toxin family protein [Marixanthotalea marina]
MIHKDSLSEKWIFGLGAKTKDDPILIEKVIRALYLLELLKKSGLDFIFKGGTALMLLFEAPKRFSIDIDIIVPNKPKNLGKVLDGILESSDFLKYSIDERQTTSSIEKEHYKFYYTPVTNARAEAEYILLDVLYEMNHYGEHVKNIELSSQFLMLEGDNVSVVVPTPEAILGDKLTAFAPNTTGVPYGKEKELEIIKQLFDIGHLFDMVSDIPIVGQVFSEFAKTELAYRGLKKLKGNDVLDDVFETALLMGTRGKAGKGEYQEIQSGVKKMKNFIISDGFNIETAMVPAAKAAYLVNLIKKGNSQIERFGNPMGVKDYILEQPLETRLNKLKKSNPEAFFYWYKALMLSTEKELTIHGKEIGALKIAIRYYKSRHSYVSDDIISSILGKLNDGNGFFS